MESVSAIAHLLRVIFPGSDDVAFVVDPDGRLIDASPGVTELFGHDVVSGAPLEALGADDEERARLRANLRVAARNERVSRARLRLGHGADDGTFDCVFAPVHGATHDDEAIAVRAHHRCATADSLAASAGDDRARAILESVTDAFFALDRSFRFTYLNGTAEKLLQRSSSELVGKNVWAEFPAARGTQFQEHYERVMATGEQAAFVEHYPAPLDRWYEVRAYPSPEGISVYFQDITDRRLAEAAYARGKDQMELVVRGAHVGVWYSSLPFDELAWDATVKEHFFLPPDARVTIDDFYARLHPDDRAPTRLAIERCLANHEALDMDYRTVDPATGATKWIRAVGRPSYDEAGAPVRFDGVTLDVSERKLAELAVRASEERYRLATRATNDVVWDWDLGTDHIAWNEAFTQRFGFAIDEVTSNVGFWTERVHPDDRARVTEMLEATIADPTREHWQAEYRFARADGEWADVFDRGFVLRDADGAGARMIGAMQDLTEHKFAEREREAILAAERAARGEAERESRMKDEFLAMLSHELRTPLNAIVGWSQILLKRTAGEGNAEVRRGLEVVMRNARAQARIIDELLDMSRMVSGKLSLDTRPVDLAALVEAAVDTARPSAEAKGVEIACSATLRPTRVLGDSARLQQAMGNLLGNAIKFTPRGGCVGVWTTVSDTGAGEQIEVSVSDTGEGIEPAFLPHVFDRFRQADGGTTRRHGGLGLGLSIVKQVVELHGGSVTARSEGCGRGATFAITLPASAAVVEAEAELAAEGGDARAVALAGSRDVDLGGVRVLVVDDEPDARAFVARVLDDHGAHVATAASAREAYELVTSRSFDVLVSDIGMPDEDGYALLRRVRALGKNRGGDVAAIALTAYARDEDRVRSVAAGFASHVAKPVDVAELVTRIAALGRCVRGVEVERRRAP